MKLEKLYATNKTPSGEKKIKTYVKNTSAQCVLENLE